MLTLIMCVAWLAPGLVGHEPWKGDEAQTMGMVHSILSRATEYIPTLAGEMQVSAPPPFYAFIAAEFAQWLSPIFPAHDGARLAGGSFIFLTLIFAALTGRELYGREHGRLVVLTLIGSIGLWFNAHESIPASAVLCGVALLGYGAAIATRRAYLGGALAGTGLGICFMSGGVVQTTALLLTTLSLPLISPAWRTRSSIQAALILLLSAVPWFTLWPWQVMHSHPAWFSAWWHVQWQQFSLSAPHPTTYYLSFLLWFAWPAWPLALWTLQDSFKRHQLNSAGIALPLALWGYTTLVLTLTGNPRPEMGLPVLLPLAWLAAGSSATLRRGAANALYWFSIMTFAVLAIAIWIYWSAVDLGYPVALAQHLHQLQPSYQGSFRQLSVFAAILYCVVWVILIARMKRAPHRPLMAWAAGMTLSWGLVAFLFVHPLDGRLSYSLMMQSLAPHLPENSCVAGLNLSRSVKAMLDYDLDEQTLMESHVDQRTCPVMLIEFPDNITTSEIPAWHIIWEGQRRGNHVEHYALYQRNHFDQTSHYFRHRKHLHE